MDSKVLRVELVDATIVQIDMFDEQPFESFIERLFAAACGKNQYKCLNVYRKDLDQHMTLAIGVGQLEELQGESFAEYIYEELASKKYTRDDVLQCLVKLTMDIKKVPKKPMSPE
jgi:hypothetical protein